jgi:hypothetical protein
MGSLVSDVAISAPLVPLVCAVKSIPLSFSVLMVVVVVKVGFKEVNVFKTPP